MICNVKYNLREKVLKYGNVFYLLIMLNVYCKERDRDINVFLIFLVISINKNFYYV